MTHPQIRRRIRGRVSKEYAEEYNDTNSFTPLGRMMYTSDADLPEFPENIPAQTLSGIGSQQDGRIRKGRRRVTSPVLRR
jgi:hypothetical protein